MTSDEVLMLDSVPSRIAVIGGGAIGCEFRVMFCRPRSVSHHLGRLAQDSSGSRP